MDFRYLKHTFQGCFICSIEVCGGSSGRCCTVCGTSGFSCVVFVVFVLVRVVVVLIMVMALAVVAVTVWQVF